MKVNIPPIKVWIWVGLAFCLFQLIVIIYYNKTNNGTEGDRWFSSQLNDIKSDFTTKSKSTYNVIIIGSSLVGNAVECPDEIVNTLANYPTKNILLKKIWQPHDPFESLITKKNLINELLLIKPDLVCIQTELAALRYEEIETFFYTNFQNYMQDLASKNATIFKDFLNRYESDFINCEDNFIDYEVVADTLKYIPAKRYVKTDTEIKFAFEGINKLIGAGIKVVIVDIPRPQKVEHIMYTKSFLKELNLLFEMYQRKFGIEHWSYSGRPMYFRDFHDGGHLNKEGRHLFTKDLLGKIVKEIEHKK